MKNLHQRKHAGTANANKVEVFLPLQWVCLLGRHTEKPSFHLAGIHARGDNAAYRRENII